MPKRSADSTEARKRRKLADEFLEAARNGDTAAVRAVLESGKLSPESFPRSKRVTSDAVHEACRGNHDECLALLLPYVKTTQMSFGVWLSECVHADHVACTEVLLQHWKSVCNNGACVELCAPVRRLRVRDCPASTACPAMWVDPAVCRVFIDAGADIDTKTRKGGRSPLHLASCSGALEVVKMLVEAGAGVNVTDDDGHTCLTHAAGNGHTETVRYFVGLPEVDVHHCGGNNQTALHWAADEGHTETVRYLVGLPEVDVNHCGCNNYTALHCAADEGHPEAVQVLIDAGADIDTKADEGNSPLHCASESGALEVVKVLVRAGAGVNVTDNDGRTCLFQAAYYGHTEIVRYLVGLPEVDVNHRDLYNEPALHCAVNNGHTEVVQILIDAGADIDTRNEYGDSPLQSASCSGALEVVKMLVEAGAAVRVTDDKGHTCLFFAAREGHTETVRYLVSLPEVDVHHRDRDGCTTWDYAAYIGYPDVERVLIDAGCSVRNPCRNEA